MARPTSFGATTPASPDCGRWTVRRRSCRQTSASSATTGISSPEWWPRRAGARRGNSTALDVIQYDVPHRLLTSPFLIRLALHRRRLWVLHLEPIGRATGAVGRALAFRNDAFEPELAGQQSTTRRPSRAPRPAGWQCIRATHRVQPL